MKWHEEDEQAEGRPLSYLTLPTGKAGSVPCLPFSSSAHATALLETLEWLPFALRKKSKLLPVTGKVPPAPVPAPSPASFSTALPHFVLRGPRSPPLVPRTGSAHPHFLPLPLPHLHVLAPSHLPGLCSHASCSELRGTFRDRPMWKPPSRHLCLTVASLSFAGPFIPIQNDTLPTC